MCHHLYCRVKDQGSSIAIIYGFVTPNFLCGRMTAKTTRSWLEPKDAYYDCMHAITSDCSSFRCSLLKLLNMDDDASKLPNISSKMLIVAWPCVYSSSPLHTEFIFCRYCRRSLCRIDTQCTATHVVLHGSIGRDVGTVRTASASTAPHNQTAASAAPRPILRSTCTQEARIADSWSTCSIVRQFDGHRSRPC
jgi:hypothetical protein